MSLNAKHYVAIGLGFVVFAGYAMHKSTSPSTEVAFEMLSGEFKPLSSFESALVEMPSQLTIGDLPSLPTIGSGLSYPVDQISTQQLAIGNESGAQQATYDSSDTLSDNNDFEFPEFVVDEEIEIPEVKTQDNVDQGVLPTHSATQELNASSAFAVAASPGSVKEQAKHHYELPNSRWKKNPFADLKMTEVPQTPALDFPTGDVSALETAKEASIIVEPKIDGLEQRLSKAAEPANHTFPPASVSMEKNGIPPEAEQISLLKSDTSDALDNSIVSVLANDDTPMSVPLSEAAGQQAVHHIEYGKSLSRRGAAFAARQEFYSALRVISQSNDAATGSNDFSKAMSEAILAMKEAKDFVQSNAESELLLDVASIIETHRSNIIDGAEALSTSSAQAMQKYFSYAQQKLHEAGGRNAVSAEAFYCLGKLHTAVAKSDIIPNRVDVARAIAFHQAALMSDANNFRSANELGVIMVRMGQLEKAIELFRQSLIAQPTPQTWGNLAKTHRRLGQQDLAQLADAEFAILSQSQIANSANPIRWMQATVFNENAPMEFHKTQRIATRPDVPAKNSESASDKAKTKIKSFGARLKELF